jgi:flagellar hook-basal body complex protein FliE
MNPVNDASSVLAQIRSYQAKISDQRAAVSDDLDGATSATSQTINFNNMVGKAFVDSMRQVNALQSEANTMMTQFEMGEDVPLTDVVMSMQKSSLAFEATLQVRNKVLKAYEDIMNMPV